MDALSQSQPGCEGGEGAVKVPPLWPRTDRPLRVAILGWARLSFQGSQGSGYNLSASELASGLVMSGHEVVYLASGRKYDLWPRMHIKRTERWRGIECFDLYNSPNASPASYNFRNMPVETSHAGQTRLILSWLERHGIQVVHVHSLEGFPLGLIGAVRESGRAVVVTPHNYWFVCPQVDLMHQEVRICTDYQGGKLCEGCLSPKPIGRTKLKRRLGQTYEAIVGMEISGFSRRIGKAAGERIAELRGTLRPRQPNSNDPDPECAAGFDIGTAARPEGDDGLIRHNFVHEPGDGRRRPVGAAPIDQNEKFLRADHHLTVLNEYGKRRQDGAGALNRASIVIPPSDFVRRVYVKMGVKDEVTRVVRLGQPHFDQINRRTRRSPFYHSRPWDPRTPTRPLRFGFFGAMRSSKGIDVLCEAIPMLPKQIRQRCQIHIRAQGHDWPLRKKLSTFPEVSFTGGYDLIQLIGCGGEYDVGLLPHVWFENSPLVLLEHLHAGKFVICSRLGGPVEWVEPPRNGLLLPGGRADDLAAAMTKLVTGEVPIPSPREIHEATPILQSYPDHVREIEGIYREVLGEEPAPAVQVRRAAAVTSG